MISFDDIIDKFGEEGVKKILCAGRELNSLRH